MYTPAPTVCYCNALTQSLYSYIAWYTSGPLYVVIVDGPCVTYGTTYPTTLL